MSAGRIITVSGPAGVGKDTLISLATRRNLGKRITAWTTRPMRNSEISGREYHFVSESDFCELRNREFMFDEMELNGYRYGTPLRIFREFIAAGETGFIHLSMSAALKARETLEGSCSILLLPENRVSLVRQLVGRGMSEPDIESRLASDVASLIDILNFDLVVISVTGQIEMALDRVERFILDGK